MKHPMALRLYLQAKSRHACISVNHRMAIARWIKMAGYASSSFVKSPSGKSWKKSSLSCGRICCAAWSSVTTSLAAGRLHAYEHDSHTRWMVWACGRCFIVCLFVCFFFFLLFSFSPGMRWVEVSSKCDSERFTSEFHPVDIISYADI